MSNIFTSERDFSKDTFEGILREKNALSPDRVFIYDGSLAYTWHDIEIISQIIANDLSIAGVKEHTHVGLMSNNSVNLICAFLAIQKLGALAIMINPFLTEREIINLSNVGDFSFLCIGDTTCHFDINNFSMNNQNIKFCYNISHSIDFKKRYNEYDSIKNNFLNERDSDDPAVMIFTSGSTGAPKGAISSYYAMYLSTRFILEKKQIVRDDIICSVMPFYHVGGLIIDFMCAFITDATLCIPHFPDNTNLQKRMEFLLDFIDKYKCTILLAVPTMLLSMTTVNSFTNEKTDSIRSVYTGAQPVTKEHFKTIMSHFKNAKIIHVYAMTEIMPISIVTSDESFEKLSETVGRPVNGVSLTINDPITHEECPVGVAGEICVKGNNSVTCYYKLDIQKQCINEKGFIPTGDLGYLDKEGYLHLTGRLKDIIIRGGENIVPKEVISTLMSLDCIQDSYVCGIPDKIMGEKVAASIVLKNGYQFDEKIIKSDLRKKLAKYKIPSKFVVMDIFPFLPNGKIDINKLKKIIENSLQ